MDEFLAESLSERRLSMLLLSAFALVACILAAVGIYGVVAFSVSQRTHEIGIRMALGAQSGDVLRLFVKQYVLLTALGIFLGLIAAFALTRILTSLLYGVSTSDPLIFLVGSLLLAVIAVLSSFFPARRATKVDPLIALRHE
jgi:putative ABC transport system permease protein